MGFFDTAFKVAARVVGAVTGLGGAPQRAQVAAAVAARGPRSLAQRAGRFARTNIVPAAVAGGTFGAADVAIQAALGDGPAAAAGGGGNGQLRTVTVVTTVDNAGMIVRRRVLKGSPHLMNRDLVIAKRVLRTAGKLGRKFSRKTREVSQTKQLLGVIQQKAIATALGVDCAPTPKTC